MNYAQKFDLFFPFFIKLVVNKNKAYLFLIIGMVLLQNILLSVKMLWFHFITAKQGTCVHKYDRGPCKETVKDHNYFYNTTMMKYPHCCFLPLQHIATSVLVHV